MSICGKSFTRSDSSKVSSLKLEIHTDTDLSQFKKNKKHQVICSVEIRHLSQFMMHLLPCNDLLADIILVFSLTDSESKELEEMLAQEDLGEMGLSSPGEQVAYLLVERATLLERLETVEMRLESRSTENPQQVKS